MNRENSEGAAQVGEKDPGQGLGMEPLSVADEHTDPMIPIDVEPPVPAGSVLAAPVLEVPSGEASDSTPPVSRKLAPPPKPKRDSAGASRPPSHRPPGDASDPLASSALKAPLAPSISYAGFPALSAPVGESTSDAVLPSAPASVPPVGAPPPITRRGSSPAIGEETEPIAASSARAPSDPALASVQPKPVTAPPRPTSSVPQQFRPRSDPPPAAATAGAFPASMPPGAPLPPTTLSAAPAPSTPTSAIFAMRIIAVGDPARPAPAPVEPPSDDDPNAYPPPAARLGTGTRRSSRPKMEAVLAPEVATDTPPDVAEAPLPSAAEASAVAAPEIEIDLSGLDSPELTALDAAASKLAASDVGVPQLAEPELSTFAIADSPRSSPLALAEPNDEHAEELSDEDVSPDSSVRKPPTTDAEELGRDDAISMPPEELAALQAEAKADLVKPPPPPKRVAGAATTSPSLDVAVASAVANATPPPTPDLAAAKAAQRKNTRPPWWEDLFNEDFMRATSRVSDEQIRREVTFIEESLGVAAGGVVLDLGCGSGHHAVEFASRGYGVVGYDLSLYQLALAADVAQERNQKINFLQGDMREMAFEEMFDGVFCWNTSFGYFEEDKNLAVAQRVFKALRPGGMFLIDVLNRDFAAASAPCTVWYEGDSCVCMDDMSVDYISSRLRVKRSIILDDGRTKESLFSLRLYSLHELGKLLHEVGFRVTEASGHPATPGVFFGPNSPRIIMLAQRP